MIKKRSKKKLILIILLCVVVLLIGGWGVLCANIYDENFNVRGDSYEPLMLRLEDFNRLQCTEYSFSSDKGQKLAGYLYSAGKGAPMICIDCTLVNEKSWDFLFDHQASPFHNRSATIYMKHLEAMPPQRLLQFLSILTETNLTKRLRLLLRLRKQHPGSKCPKQQMQTSKHRQKRRRFFTDLPPGRFSGK